MGINTALYNGLSGLNSFSTALSVVSDNVANASTTGFKSNSVRFGDMVNSFYAILSNDVEREGAGSTVMGFATNYGQGAIGATNNWSDLAMSGEGFFTVKDSANNNTYYTRDASFHVDDNGFLVNQQGFIVQNAAGADIQIANPSIYTKFRVETDGQIYAIDNTLVPPAEVAITGANLGLANFSNKDGLIRAGLNLYSQGPEVGTVYTNATNPEMFGKVTDFSLEGSNVDLAKEMVDMIVYQADYNANSKTITTSANLLETSINMVR